MAKKPPLTDEERAERQAFAFNAEAARAAMFAAAMDTIQTMQAQGLAHNEAPVLTGMIEATTQMWTHVMIQAGHSPSKARAALIGQVNFFFHKHRDTVDAPEAVAS